jgi:hypothetical protein
MQFAVMLPEMKNGNMEYAAVSDTEHLDVCVVCLHRQDGTWDPIFMIKRREGCLAQKRQLPPCFSLNDESLAALDWTWDIHHV